MRCGQHHEVAAEAFTVVLNELGQYSLWREGTGAPPGWRRVSAPMSRDDCLALIERSWRNMAPASPGAWDGAHGAAPAHELVAGQAARNPGATAVASGRTRVTYGELEASAGRLARRLREAGAGPEAVVGVHLDRGADMVRVILAVMKAGAAYMPLDPSLPPDRLAAICAQARPAAVVTARAGQFPVPGTRLVPLNGPPGEPARRPAESPPAHPAPGNVCYVICTSGTTGEPKAVAVSYGSLACTVPALAREYQVIPGDRVAQVASLAFDTSIEQVFTTLASGATLVMPPPGTMAPSRLLRGIERGRVTVIDLTPAYWHQLLALTVPADQRLRSVRLMITGGESADPADWRAARQAAPWARLLNAYGLTETTITSALHEARAEAADTPVIPAGQPAGHARILVLDEQLRPVPAGTGGEVCIGGCQVARGYLGRPALTAERFVPDPGGGPGARMYRTGDLGRWLSDGALEVTGRMDRQLKVRGYRVEPAEIESVLAGHPDIGEVTVTADGGPGGTRLTARYTPRRDEAGAARRPSAASLRRYLLDRLPGYMVPSAFVPCQHLSREPGRPHEGPAAGGERHTPVEAGLAALWGRLLGREHVSLDDDFFALGGDSLAAAEMLASAEAVFGVPPDAARPLTRCLLRDPTLRAFAGAVRDARAGRLGDGGGQPETDFAAEAALGVTVRAAPARPPGWRQPREVLLTGATGFLGAHLLSELLTATGARVWCLARAGGKEEAGARVAAAAARFELPAPPAGRVVPLPGDLARPGLGLPEAAFSDLASRLDVIYHVGAQVNFVYPYQALRAANVDGTREVIRLAGQARAVPVHYVSTTAVLAGLGAAGVREATEDTVPAWPERLRMGYAETKYVAEELLRNAARAGLPVAVYRPFDIVGSLATGIWPASTELAALIRFMADTGLAPAVDLPLDLVAADACAKAIRHISVTREAAGQAYHLSGPGRTPLSAVAGRLRGHGYEITEVPFGEWARELARQAARDPSRPMTAFLPLFTDPDPVTGLTVAETYLGHVFPSYASANTERALRGSGIAFAPGSDLLDRNIGRLIEDGHLPPPPATGRPPGAR